MITAFASVILKATPLTCTNPDTGNSGQFDNPLGGLPFIGGAPDNCVNGQSLAGQAYDAVAGPGQWQQAVADTVKSSATFWVNQPSPTIADPDTHVISGAAANLNNSLLWLTFLVMATCIAVKGGQIAWAGAKGGEPLGELVKGIFDWIIAAGCFAGIIGVVLVATDQIAPWLIDQSTNGGDFAKNLGAFMDDPSLLNGIGNIMGYGLMGLALLFAFLQELLFAARGGTLVVLVGAYLLSASAASIRQGRDAHAKLTAWIIAFTLYKLAAAMVYAGAFWLIGTPSSTGNAGWMILQGVGLMITAIVALYALIKLAMPATEPAVGHGYMQGVTTAAFLAR